jgi:O-acetyl-ADP-ribose deacetylase (regulator of RNase III)
VAFERLIDPERPVELEIGDFGTLDEVEAEVAELALDAATPLVLGVRLKSPPPFTVLEAVRAILQALEGTTREVVLVFATEAALVAGERMLPGGARPPRCAHIGRFAVWVKTGDIAVARADAVVNASSTTLHLGGGVSGAIRSAAARPDALQAAMVQHAPLEPGGVATTASFGLPHASTILHAATANGGAEAVRRALQRILELADTLNIRTLALPALGTGTGGLSRGACVALVDEALRTASEVRPAGALHTVELVLHDGPTADLFAAALGAA